MTSDESGAAQRIADAIRPLPGVAAVDNDYRKTFTHGENFDLTVELAPDATADQAQRVARTFVAESEGVGFGEPIAAALNRLDRPVELTMDGAGDYIRITVGGCRRHDPGHRPSRGEAKLAQIHERC
ncbi:hypothetical protein O6P37_25395 [Mycobacterium sp. CPCC 205372]|uniref:Uncharacterized protein n=1 Tax=Mycobacterium hippophais TaxID=3016340 RepID=A0ABT4Q052_9MYCO|nr:hypothetical protein [Mycobacterium hippophais]MCZ8382210.1 hypothetical protein [Mycobacterium hippophais]